MIRDIQMLIGYRQLELTLCRMKFEILQDMLDGRVHGQVSDFGTLHSFVDANEYGGFCDDNPNPFNGLTNDEQIDVMNYCQTQISEWLSKRN